MLSEIFSFEKFISACQYICWFLILNLLFIISNAPLIIFILGVGIDEIMNYLPFFMLCTLPLGPSLCAMFSSMRRLIKEKDVRPFYQFKRSYLQNARQSYLVSALMTLAIFILVNNLYLFTKMHYFLPAIILFGFFLLLLLCTIPHTYMLMTRYQMPIKTILKTALILTITRPGMTLGNCTSFLVCCMIFEIKPGTSILFIGSIYAFLIVFINRSLYKTLDSTSTT